MSKLSSAEARLFEDRVRKVQYIFGILAKEHQHRVPGAEKKNQSLKVSP